MRHFKSLAFCGVAILATIVISTSAKSADSSAAPPRYKLTVGQQLTYHGESKFEYEGGGNRTMTDAVHRVVAQNPDGSWHVVGAVRSMVLPEHAVLSSHQETVPAELFAFDVTPDGRVSIDPADKMRGDPTIAFQRLPDGATDKSWICDNGDDGKTTFHTAPATQPSDFAAAGVVDNTMDKVYESTRTVTYTFDRARGFVTHTANEVTQNYGIHGKGGGSMDLTAEEIKSPEWIEQYAKESFITLTAIKQYQAAMNAAANAPDAETKMSAALEILKSAKANVTLPQLTLPILDNKINSHDSYVKYAIEEAADRAQVVGKPAPEWDLVDLQGNHHAVKDLRGKVIVLDFWYRGCGWCMKAMPQMKKLAADFNGKPVAIFGANTDEDAKDAQVVVDLFAIPYPTLRANAKTSAGRSALAEQYHVQGFPTLILIGPDGVVRDVHVGYSPTLHDDLTNTINELLAKQ